jgi:hypothetical protein
MQITRLADAIHRSHACRHALPGRSRMTLSVIERDNRNNYTSHSKNWYPPVNLASILLTDFAPGYRRT